MFSVVFAVNSAGLIAASQVGGRIVGRVGAPALLRVGAFGVALGSIGVLVATVDPRRPRAAADRAVRDPVVATASYSRTAPPPRSRDQEGALGSASALLGVGQFGTGAVWRRSSAWAARRDALPMGILIGVCGVSALAVNLAFGPRTGAPAATVGSETPRGTAANIDSVLPAG